MMNQDAQGRANASNRTSVNPRWPVLELSLRQSTERRRVDNCGKKAGAGPVGLHPESIALVTGSGHFHISQRKPIIRTRFRSETGSDYVDVSCVDKKDADIKPTNTPHDLAVTLKLLQLCINI